MYSDCISGVRKLDGKIHLDNGKHRCWALYNSDYDKIEMPVLDTTSPEYQRRLEDNPFEMT